MNVYEFCPTYQNERFSLELTTMDHCEDLLAVYSDTKAVPYFNADNCNGDDFHYTTRERMAQAIDFWQMSYREGWFVRWSILDRTSGHAVGTIELFYRGPSDAHGDTALLRLDLRSDYEKAEPMEDILSLIVPPAYELFGAPSVTTKCPPFAAARQSTLTKLGFRESPEPLIGHDGTEYYHYYVLRKR